MGSCHGSFRFATSVQFFQDSLAGYWHRAAFPIFNPRSALTPEATHGCGSKPMVPFYFKVGAPPILVYFSWDWDVH